jgi:hypothetical protein
MVKSKRSRSKSPRSRSPRSRSPRSKSPKIDDFMKKSIISPMFQYHEENYPISLEPHTSHASHAYPGTDNVKPVSYQPPNYYDSNDENDSEGYTSSDNESYIDSDGIGEKNDMMTPIEETYANTTRKKDLKIYRMKDLLSQKKKIMFEKEKEIKELGKQNSFLETVVHDYENYNTIILEEKIKQKKALKILSDHIREISKNIKSDDFKLSRVKLDQTLLLEEIQNIRDEIEHVLKSNGRNNVYMSSDDEYNKYEDDSTF